MGALQDLDNGAIGQGEFSPDRQRGQTTNWGAITGQILKTRNRRGSTDVIGSLVAFLIHDNDTGDRRLSRQNLVALSVGLADLIQFLDGRTRRHRIDARQGIGAQRSPIVQIAFCSCSDAVELGERLAGDLLDVLPGFGGQLHA
ncbi:hypothetical protein F753_01685 [Stutzerimonas chloritidismutans AW-1]|uniref:Uncharacterized protein n=1 Tax=Stutzerimonas chloritidismutans AW-1 TaxID=1263865 RepID=V4S868_STUCH|nr:hypothetical protein F753_01685 [Stutzerimonas chloritidismutans AW-1]